MSTGDWPIWKRAAHDPEIIADLRAIYARVEPTGTCAISGRCCKFAEYGHRLWATGLEIAYAAMEPMGDADCPYQVGGLCGIHERRPLGCRVYFCNADKAEMRKAHEKSMEELSELHRRHGLPLERFEWNAGLKLCNR